MIMVGCIDYGVIVHGALKKRKKNFQQYVAKIKCKK